MQFRSRAAGGATISPRTAPEALWANCYLHPCRGNPTNQISGIPGVAPPQRKSSNDTRLPNLFESDGDRFRNGRDCHLCFAGNIQRLRKKGVTQGRVKVHECAFEVLHHAPATGRAASILCGRAGFSSSSGGCGHKANSVPLSRKEDRDRQLSQPLRP